MFRTIFTFLKPTKCYKLQHFCVLTSFAGTMQKCRKCCEYQYFFRPEMHKTQQIPVFLKAKQKKHSKLQHFWRVDRKKLLVFTQFLECQENVEGTKHCKEQCFGHFWTPKRWYLRSFFGPWRRQTPVKSQLFLHFLNRFFCLDQRRKTLVFTRFSKNRRSWCERNPINNSVLSTLGN